VLERSVHGTALLALGKELQLDAVAHPWASVLELPDQTSRRLAVGDTMSEVFDEIGRALLILGAPGSGKTISMLELTRDLIDRAAEDHRQPVPVVFNLSTWTDHGTLLEWMVEELKARYFVPAQKGRAWLQSNRLILLLDGLDEVRAESRAACVEAINGFVQDVGVPGVAVCSRLDDYLALPVRLTLRGAVRLQPLTTSQVRQYVSRAGPELDGLRIALQSDSQLQTLAETPLMLSVMSLAYGGLSAVAPPTGISSPDERRKHLFATYVDRMFARHGSRAVPYRRERVVHWLTWLAGQLQRHGESMFLVERLQPDWLATRSERWVYTTGSRLVGGAALGLVLGLILALTLSLIEGAVGGLRGQARDFGNRLTVGLVFGLINGLVIGLIDAWRFERPSQMKRMAKRRTIGQAVADISWYVLPLVVVGWQLVSRLGQLNDAATGLVFGVLVALLFGLFFDLHNTGRGFGGDIRTVEALGWSWREARRSCGRGLVAGLSLGLLLGLLGALQEKHSVVELVFVLLVGLIGCVLGCLVGGIFGGLRSTIVPAKAAPNQGIRLSIGNALVAGLVIGLAMGTITCGVSSIFLGPAHGLAAGIVAGLFFGLLAGLRDGGLDVIQHYTLRLLLVARGYAPLRYPRFLNYGTRLIFLQKAGGGYLFVHRLLLDHFVDQK